ncbi:MAG: hypothetical protein PWP23_855 [Candidatus Sumerlaeota bacterium]|nr:hypothetical protein [Candidatus Sumerlaeota bacterium]
MSRLLRAGLPLAARTSLGMTFDIVRRMAGAARRPGAVAGLYLAAALAPWFLLNQQEKLRYTDGVGLLWPLWTVLTGLYALLLGVVVWQNLWPLAGSASEPAAPPRPNRWRRWVGAAAVLVLFAVLTPSLLRYGDKVWLDPVSVAEADMVPLVESALRQFWVLHHTPYAPHEVGHWWLWLTFMPGLWLPYSIPFFLSVDIRTWCMGTLAAASLLLFLRGAGGAAQSRHWATALACVAPVAVPFFLLWTETFGGFLSILHLGGFWLTLVLWCLALRAGSHFLAGVLFAFAVLSRPYMVVLVPFYAAWSFRHWRENRSDVVRAWAGMVLTGLVVAFPFFVHDPKAFLGGVLSGYDIQLSYHVSSNRWATHGFGFTGLLQELDVFDWKMRVALLLEVFFFVAVCRRIRDAQTLLTASAAALFLFLWFTIIPFFYTFVAPLIILAMAAPSFGPDRVCPAALPHAMRRRWILAVAVTCTVLVGFFVLRPLFDVRERIPWLALDGTDNLFESKELQQGFDAYGWVDNTGSKERRVTLPNAYFSLPVRDLTHRLLVVEYECATPRADGFVDVCVNNEYLGSYKLDQPGRQTGYLLVPRKNLFVGGNQVRLRLRRGAEHGTEDLPDYLGLLVWKATLVEYKI